MNEDFYGSIDRLVEYGMSDRMATSMIQAMNQAMATMKMPNYSRINQICMQSPVPVPAADVKKFFAAIADKPVGPLGKDELTQRIALGEIQPDTLIWYRGLPGWAPARQLDEVRVLFSMVPPEMPGKN